MKNYEIANKYEIDIFMSNANANGQSLTSVKGEAPFGAMYSCGDLIGIPVNIAWFNESTGESINIIYQIRQEAEGGE